MRIRLNMDISHSDSILTPNIVRLMAVVYATKIDNIVKKFNSELLKII